MPHLGVDVLHVLLLRGLIQRAVVTQGRDPTERFGVEGSDRIVQNLGFRVFGFESIFHDDC